MRHKHLHTKTILVLIAFSASLTYQMAHAQSGEPTHSVNEDSFKSRFEHLNKEITKIKSETDDARQVVDALKETSNCLRTIHNSITTLADRLTTLGTRGDTSSYAGFTGVLASKHVAFFDSLDDFSKTSLFLTRQADGSTVADNTQLQDHLEKMTMTIAQLKQQFAAQANEEEVHLAKLSQKLIQLKRAIASAESDLEKTRRCAPALEVKSKKLIEDAKHTAAHLSQSRQLIAEIQGKRARVLGALTSSLKKKVIAQLANASQQTADTLVKRINQTLAELHLRSEIERWWFIEVLEQGPARGYLVGPSSNPLKASEALQVAIATSDALIASARELRGETPSNVSTQAYEGESTLERNLFQRREALNRWLRQTQTSLPIAAQ